MKKAFQAVALVATSLASAGAALAQDSCGGATGIDNCLIGSWQMEGGGPAEWMRKNMPEGVKLPQMPKQDDIVIQYRADGTYASQMADEASTGRVAMKGLGALSGDWATAEQTLHICSSSTADSATLSVGEETMPLQLPAAGPQSFEYECNGDTLVTRRGFPGIPEPMVTRFGRVSE